MLIKTYMLNPVDPQTYFAGAITRIVNGQHNPHFDDLLPWHDNVTSILKAVD